MLSLKIPYGEDFDSSETGDMICTLQIVKYFYLCKRNLPIGDISSVVAGD